MLKSTFVITDIEVMPASNIVIAYSSLGSVMLQCAVPGHVSMQCAVVYLVVQG